MEILEFDEEEATKITLVKKICMLGDPAVGKTSLVSRFVHSVFDNKYIATIGANVSRKDVEIPHLERGILYHLKFMIWDIAGQETFDWIKPTYYRNAEGALLVCDITRRETLENLENWRNALFNVTGKIPIVVVVNKCDLKDAAQFSGRDVKHKMSGLDIYFTSAKTGENVEKCFKRLGKLMVEALPDVGDKDT